VTWLRTDAARVAGVDPERVVLVGEPAGAHLAALVAVAPDVAAFRPEGVAPSVSGIRGVVGVSGVYDLTVPVAGRNADVRAFLGCEQADCPDRYAAASPISHLDAGDPPHLVYHGTDDEVVPYANATAYRDRLRALGVPVSLVTGAGGGHVDPYAGPWADRMASARAAFLRERLDLDP
jgi:acetyl esterase/lipase